MNKMSEKVVAVMNPQELELVIGDHYVGESQTLTTGAEQNILKLAEMRGTLTPAQAERWEEIKKGFARNAMAGGDESDPMTKVTNLLATLAQQVEGIPKSIETASKSVRPTGDGAPARMTLDTESLAPLQEAIKKLAERPVEAPQKSTLEPQIAKYLAGLHEVLAKLAQAPQRAAVEAPDLSKSMEGLSLALAKLAERPAPAASAPAGPTAVGAGGADFGQYMAGLQEALTKLADRPAAASPSGVGGADFGKYMAGLQEALTKLADRPVQIVGGTTHSAGPPAGPPLTGASAAGGSPAHLPYLAPPPATPSPEGGVSDAQTQDAIDKVLQALRKIAEMVRGPQSRTILLDGRLVEAFDALREAEDIEDVLRALRPIRKSNAKPKA